MRAAENIKREIVKKYNEDPRDWSVHAGRDKKGYYNLIIAHGSTAWIIKEEQINPYKFVGFGAKTNRRAFDSFLNDIPNNYGIRSANKKQMKALTDALEKKESIKEILLNIMTSKPVSQSNIDGPLIFQGPIFYSNKPIDTISSEQRKLDYKLRYELERLINKKYSQIRQPYI